MITKFKFLLNCILIVSLESFLSSCGKKDEVCGLYIAINHLNTIDTLMIKESGEYTQSVYRKDDKSLVFRCSNKWKHEGKSITFYELFPDEDEKYSRERVFTNADLITSIYLVKLDSGRSIIYNNGSNTEVYFEKQ